MPRLTPLELGPNQPSPTANHTIAQTSPARPLSLRLQRLQALLALVQPVPTTWLSGAARGLASQTTQAGGESSEFSMVLIPCESYHDLVKAWRNALKWSKGLDNALAIMLASSMSTQFVGEQLWFKVIGPPSCGKTTLMEGLATARQWYLSKDTIRGFHSGWKSNDGKDVSIAEMVKGKTLGTKDGDTLLKAPNLKQILAEGRALYDRVSRTNYRNDVNREYMGHRMTWHLAGTSALREIDDSELGARFLDIVVMEGIDDEFEDEVGWRAANQEARNMTLLSDGKPESQHPEELARAMALSGGYLDFLRTNALEIAKSVEISDARLEQCNKFGKFIAFMRARQARDVDEQSREFSARLVKQLTRLSISLAGTLGKSSVDEEVMSRVRCVMMHTSRGITLDLLKVLVNMPQGAEIRGISALLHMPDEKVRGQLRFLRKIGVIQADVSYKRFRISPRVERLYKEVRDGESL